MRGYSGLASDTRRECRVNFGEFCYHSELLD